MHEKAVLFDRNLGYDNRFGGNGPRWPEGIKAPKGRPCDGCGEPIYDGKFIHVGCMAKETELWLDILY